MPLDQSQKQKDREERRRMDGNQQKRGEEDSSRHGGGGGGLWFALKNMGTRQGIVWLAIPFARGGRVWCHTVGVFVLLECNY